MTHSRSPGNPSPAPRYTPRVRRERDGAGFGARGVAALAAGHGVHDTYSGFLPPLLPELMGAMALSRAEAGALTVFLQGPSLLQPLVGHIADRTDLRRAVALAPAVTAVAMSLLPAVTGYLAAAALLLVAGLAAAVLHAAGPPLAGRLSGRHLGSGMGLWMVGGELGRAVGPVVVVTAIQFLGHGGTPWLALGGGAASAALLAQAGRWPTPEPRPRADGDSFARGLRDLVPLLVPLAVLIAARSFVVAAATVYLPMALRERGTGLWLSGAALTLVEAAGVAGAMAGGWLSDRVGRRRVLALSLLGASALLTALDLARGAARAALLAPLGLVALAGTPAIMAIVQEAVPARRSLANGLYMALAFTVRSAVVVLVGAIADRLGFSATYLLCAAAGLAAVPAALALPRPAAPPS